MTEQEKQIEEMVEHIHEYVSKQDSAIVLNYEFGGKHKQGIATKLYNAGYRKETQGEWIMRENKSPTQIEAYCSICGRDAVYQVIDNRWQFENYCPHCGANMKGE